MCPNVLMETDDSAQNITTKFPRRMSGWNKHCYK